jgi:UDP-N-acetylglucosamine diphosphorylase/glucosamine-1-phosphate N-acetyltransferase
MKIIVFEDDKFDLLFPLSMMRAVYDVRPGAFSILEKTALALGKEAKDISLHCRKSIEEFMRSDGSEVNSFNESDYLLLNGRFIFGKKTLKELRKSKATDKFFVKDDAVVYAVISKGNSSSLNGISSNSEGVIDEEFLIKAGLKREEAGAFEISEIRYPWDAVSYLLKGGLDDDLDSLSLKHKQKKNRAFKNPGAIEISSKAKLGTSVAIDASSGKVIIEDGVVIEPFVFIKGPVYVGKNCLIKSGAKIYGPCVIGEGSKVAGEIAESVFHSHVNKQHDGFVGHSYVCPFVNLGADTVTSDLKNNYSNIRQKFRGGDIDTGMRFLGSILGDHTKTSINTMLNTGTISGIFANIFGGGFPSKNIRSFSWNEAGKTSEKYDFKKAMETANIVMSRRGLKATDEYISLAGKYFADDSE